MEADYSTDWLDVDGNWALSPQGETLWDDETIRWRPDLPEEILDDITRIDWLKRAHDSPQGEWTVFATGEADSPTIGHLGSGYWDVTYRVFYGIMSYFQGVTKDKYVTWIASVTWAPGYDGQVLYHTDEDYSGPRVFPEYNSPTPTDTELEKYNKVKVTVHLTEPVPPNYEAYVEAKVFDPDHAHKATEHGDDLDPNDPQLFEDPTLTRPNDNRHSSGTDTGNGTFGFGTRVGASLEMPSLIFFPDDVQKTQLMTIDDAQPGNNFKVVAVASRHAMANVKFAEDGVTFKRKWEGNPNVPVPGKYVSEMLTVWRTLWIESDSWKAADPMVDGPFEPQAMAFDDFNPGDIPDAPLDLLYPAYYSANIVVKNVGPSGFSVGRIRSKTAGQRRASRCGISNCISRFWDLKNLGV